MKGVFHSHSLTFVPQVSVCTEMSVQSPLRDLSPEGDRCNAKALRADYTTVHPSQHIWRKGRTIVLAQRGID